MVLLQDIDHAGIDDYLNIKTGSTAVLRLSE